VPDIGPALPPRHGNPRGGAKPGAAGVDPNPSGPSRSLIVAGSRLIIEVTPSRLEAAVVRGHSVVASRSLRHHPAEEGPGWEEFLSSLAGPLDELVAALDARGLPAVVLAHSPTAAVVIHSCPAGAGAASAESAAMLSLANLASFSLDGQPALVLPVARDTRAEAPGTPQRHVLACVESDASALVLARWIERAGLRFEGCLPLEAVESWAAARDVIAAHAESSVRATLWLGEHRSVLAVGSPGRLRFVRPIGMGVETFVDALVRPIQRRGGEGEPITLTRDEARAMLAAHGVPAPTQPIDEARGLEGASVLPVLQPILQRLALEVKQSLRFGLSEPERLAASFSVGGPGSRVPRLRQHVASSLAAADARTSIPADAASAEPPTIAYDSATHGGIHAFIASRHAFTPLLPSASADARLNRRVRLSLRAGVAACLAMVLGQGTLTWLERLAAPPAAGGAAWATPAARAAIDSARAHERGLSLAVESRLGSPLLAAPFLSLLAEAAPGQVRLTGVEFDRTERGAVARVRGRTDTSDAAEAPAALRRFIDALGACPGVTSATLTRSQRSTDGDASTQNFEVEARLVPTAPVVAAPVQEETP
jgi:hypothetical protein